MRLLERLFEVGGLPAYDLPPALVELYDGPIGFTPGRLCANFVSSIDGVVALDSIPRSPAVISGKSEADRFVMGLLRACAAVVLIGAGTLRAEPDHVWTPDYIYPEAADYYRKLRAQLRLAPEPELVVVTASGELNPELPALRRGATVAASGQGAERLRGRVPRPSNLLEVASDGSVNVRELIATLRARRRGLILSEAGPSLMGQLVRHALIDELFLTLSPLIVGRNEAGGRPGLVEGADLLAGEPPLIAGELLSLRRHGSHLFLRYALAGTSPSRSRRAGKGF